MLAAIRWRARSLCEPLKRAASRGETHEALLLISFLRTTRSSGTMMLNLLHAGTLPKLKMPLENRCEERKDEVTLPNKLSKYSQPEPLNLKP